jgi:branched-chain amino acid transport system ATP-binding protein
MALLECAEVTRRYGGVRALDGISLTMERGGVHGIVGPNGSGKTTLFNVLSGFVRPQSGAVRFDGRDITRWPAHRRARHGLVRTFQHAMAFPGLSVREAMDLAALASGAGAADVARVTESVRLGDFLDMDSESIPFGAARRLGVALALLREPKLLLLDEPAAGLNDSESAQLGDLLIELAAGGMDVLVVEHDLTFLTTVCTDLFAIDAGQLVTHGAPADVLADPHVVESYLGKPYVAD